MKNDRRLRVLRALTLTLLAAAAGWTASVLASRPSESTLSASQQPRTTMTIGPIDDPVVAPAKELGDALSMVAMHVRGAVVSVYSERIVKRRSTESPFSDEDLRRLFERRFRMQPQQGRERGPGDTQRGMGSGMIVDAQGHVLTNNHVVADVDEVKVRLADEREFEAEVVSTDPRTDVAVIRIKGDVPRDLPIVQLGDSDALMPGNLVMAIGAPFGLTQTITQGIISATGRSNVGIADFEDFLQTDAAINPGNSGGPLVNMRGEVVGMNSAIATSVGQYSGVGFAIPVKMIKAMLPTLVKGEQVTRGMLGVIVQDVDDELAQQFGASEASGALVAQVNPGSPAEKAGVKAGDVVLRLDGKPVTSSRDLKNRIAWTAPGTKVALDVLREGKSKSISATVGTLANAPVEASAERPETAREPATGWGFEAETLTQDLARELEVDARRGAVVSMVEPGGAAARAGLQPGDLVVEVDHRAVASVEEMNDALARSREKGRALLLVKRAGSSLFVVLRA